VIWTNDYSSAHIVTLRDQPATDNRSNVNSDLRVVEKSEMNWLAISLSMSEMSYPI
jgi:hypothetical protein